MDEWTGKIIPSMAKKAKLTPDQTESLTAYIVAARRPQPAISENAIKHTN